MNGTPEAELPKAPVYVLGVVNILSWFRLMSFLRLFKKTRALIRLVIEVIKDMGAFVIVLTMALLSFSITYNIFNGT